MEWENQPLGDILNKRYSFLQADIVKFVNFLLLEEQFKILRWQYFATNLHSFLKRRTSLQDISICSVNINISSSDRPKFSKRSITKTSLDHIGWQNHGKELTSINSLRKIQLASINVLRIFNVSTAPFFLRQHHFIRHKIYILTTYLGVRCFKS